MTVDIALTTAPLAVPAWTSVASKVFDLDITTGKQQELDAVQPGVAVMTLDNHDRRFDPLYAAGPYFGNLLPNKRMRVRATYGATTYDLFTGFVDDWPLVYGGPLMARSRIVAYDAFTFLARADLTGDPYRTAVLTDLPAVWYRMNEQTGIQMNDSSATATHPGQLSADATQNRTTGLTANIGATALTLDGVSFFTVPYNFTGTGDFAIEFWLKGPPPVAGAGTIVFGALGPGSNVLQITVDASGWYFVATDTSGANTITAATTSPISGSPFVGLEASTPHHFVFTRFAGHLYILIDGAVRSIELVNSGNPSLNTIGSKFYWTSNAGLGQSTIAVDEFAIYPGVLSVAQAAAHYQAGAKPWDGDKTGARIGHVLDAAGMPSTGRNLDTGQTTLGPATWTAGTKALPYLNRVAATEQGAFYIDHAAAGAFRFRDRATPLTATRSTTVQAVFSDDGTDPAAIHYSAPVLSSGKMTIVNTVTVNWAGGSVIAADATSVTAYGPLGKTIDTLLQSQSEAQSLADWLLAKHKDVFVRVRSFTVTPSAMNGATQDAAYAAALGLREGDRVTFRWQPQGLGTAISFATLIEGKHHVTSDTSWATTFWCSPADIQSYWILGTSLLGSTTTLTL